MINKIELDKSNYIIDPETRKSQELKRVQKRMDSADFKYASELYASTHFNEKTASELIIERNNPYAPKCDKELASRISKLTKFIKLFSTIKHQTSSDGLTSILNTALFGRETLIKQGMPYKPSCLGSWDIENGDGDVICFAPYRIDPIASSHPNTIEITLDFDKISKTVTNCFFKQRDLGFIETSIFEFTLGKKKFRVDPISGSRSSLFTCMVIVDEDTKSCSESYLPKDLVISDNIEQMSEIIIGLFFRYIDNLIDSNTLYSTKQQNKTIANFIYTHLQGLSDQALSEFLTKIGISMVQTAEVYFYGAYPLDFSSMLSIVSKNRNLGMKFELKLADLITNLNKNDTRMLLEAYEKLPELFKSDRFVDYLSSQIYECAESKNALEKTRKGIIHRSKPEKFNFFKTPSTMQIDNSAKNIPSIAPLP